MNELVENYGMQGGVLRVLALPRSGLLEQRSGEADLDIVNIQIQHKNLFLSHAFPYESIKKILINIERG